MDEPVKYTLDESLIPKAWYNIAADLPVPLAPPLHPGTGKPIGPDDLAPLFPMSLIQQEVSAERWIEIPDPVRDVYRQWRVTPLYRARRLEKALGTPAKIYYKYEGTSPSGSHKPNTAVPQAFYNREAGIRRISTERRDAEFVEAAKSSCSVAPGDVTASNEQGIELAANGRILTTAYQMSWLVRRGRFPLTTYITDLTAPSVRCLILRTSSPFVVPEIARAAEEHFAPKAEHGDLELRVARVAPLRISDAGL